MFYEPDSVDMRISHVARIRLVSRLTQFQKAVFEKYYPMEKTNPVEKKRLRTFQGVVVSDAMNKTIVVSVSNTKTNVKYKKQILVSKKYKVHDEKEKYGVGDKVTFVECRPISKDKRWRVVY